MTFYSFTVLLACIQTVSAVGLVSQAIDKNTAIEVCKKIYDVSGMSAHGAHHGGGLYGETGYEGLGAVLDKINAKSSDVFYDLGSGNGKLNVFASMVYGFQKSVGIELSNSRHQQACKALEELKGNSTHPGSMPSGFRGTLTFTQGDFTYMPISDADIIFGGLLPDDALQKQLTDKFRTMKNGAKILMLRELNADYLKNIKEESKDNYKLSWQSSHPIYEYSRKDGQKSPTEIKKEEADAKAKKDAEDKAARDAEFKKKWGGQAVMAIQDPEAAAATPHTSQDNAAASPSNEQVFVYEFARDESKPLQQDAPADSGVQNQVAAAQAAYSSTCTATW